ncbi:hypothetical protein [Microbacterium marinilacus]|uniref:hypothetical protein n=1 Tax=Microbacterium marinilacus TaxID=415209 RepID=UPI001C8DEBB0|nr:hypothetical protein [Microbacterium marinilacus]
MLGVVGITAAGFVADVISILATKQVLPSRGEWASLLRVAGGALTTAVAPGFFLLLAVWDVIGDHAALVTARNIYIVTLAVIGWLVVRRSRLSAPRKMLVLTVLVALGILVIAVQTLAHGGA